MNNEMSHVQADTPSLSLALDSLKVSLKRERESMPPTPAVSPAARRLPAKRLRCFESYSSPTCPEKQQPSHHARMAVSKRLQKELESRRRQKEGNRLNRKKKSERHEPLSIYAIITAVHRAACDLRTPTTTNRQSSIFTKTNDVEAPENLNQSACMPA